MSMVSLHQTPEEMMIRFLTFTHDVWGLLPGGAVFSGNFPKALAKLVGANHLEIFFFLTLSITKKEPQQKTMSRQPPWEKPFQENR